MTVDLCVNVSDYESVDSFVNSARQLGLKGFATTLSLRGCDNVPDGVFRIYSRVNLTGETPATLRRQIDQFRHRCVVLAVPLCDSVVTSTIVGDPRIDLLSMMCHDGEQALPMSTARIAATSGVALEITAAPLIRSSGLERSRLLKTLRTSVRVAQDAGMRVVLSSESSFPIDLRSPAALMYIGRLVGLSGQTLRDAVYKLPVEVVDRNLERLQDYVVRPADIMLLR